MKARQLFEASPAPAPVAPPKPGVKPGAPPAPAKPAPQKFPNPFRRRNPGVEPGPMPRPKACGESSAKRLFQQEAAQAAQAGHVPSGLFVGGNWHCPACQKPYKYTLDSSPKDAEGSRHVQCDSCRAQYKIPTARRIKPTIRYSDPKAQSISPTEFGPRKFNLGSMGKLPGPRLESKAKKLFGR